jgi:hypothetical protein
MVQNDNFLVRKWTFHLRIQDSRSKMTERTANNEEKPVIILYVSTFGKVDFKIYLFCFESANYDCNKCNDLKERETTKTEQLFTCRTESIFEAREQACVCVCV